jgi:hypothetical protein
MARAYPPTRSDLVDARNVHGPADPLKRTGEAGGLDTRDLDGGIRTHVDRNRRRIGETWDLHFGPRVLADMHPGKRGPLVLHDTVRHEGYDLQRVELCDGHVDDQSYGERSARGIPAPKTRSEAENAIASGRQNLFSLCHH